MFKLIHLEYHPQHPQTEFLPAEDEIEIWKCPRNFLHSLLASKLKISSEQIHLIYSSQGKPELDPAQNPLHLSFNLSHSHEITLIAMGRNVHLGIDVEKIRSIEKMEAIIYRFFKKSEIETIRKAPPNHQALLFFKYWCAKEAYSKMLGISVFQGMKELEFHPHENLFEWSPTPGYIACLMAQPTFLA